MFCPKCATQNIDGASFCRSCGANVSLIPQALSGQLPTKQVEEELHPDDGSRRRRRGVPNIDNAVRSLMMGVAFAVISIMVSKYAPGGWTWWYWLLIPAFMMAGKGISDLVRLNQCKTAKLPGASVQSIPASRPESLPTPRTAELRSPVPSVTEGTTRHLGVEAATRHFDSWDSQKPS